MAVLLILVALTTTYASPDVHDVNYFHTGIFYPNRDPGLYEIETGLEVPGHLLAAFGYFNDDKLCDVAVLNEARNTVEIYLWNDFDGEFVHQSSLDLKTSGYIENVIPGDFDLDGELDLLVTRNASTVQVVEIYIRQKPYSNDPQFSYNVSGQPAAFDVSGDMSMDLVMNMIDGDGSIQAFVASKEDSPQMYVPRPLLQYAFKSSEHCLQPSNRPLLIPNSVAFVDLNKDCLADMFLTTYDNVTGQAYFEVWLNMKNGMYCIVYDSPAPEGTGHATFADVDRNGAEDLLFPVCLNVNCTEQEIRVVFNDNIESSSCDFDSNIVSYRKFTLPSMNVTNTTESTLVLPLDKPYSFVQTDPNIPITLRTGDFDLDGYPDFLAIVDDDSGKGPYCALFLNKKADSGRRTFVMQSGGEFEKLEKKRGAYLCTFFDLDENGVFDILVTSKNETGVSMIYSFYNNFLEDAFHLKALTLSGVGKQQYSSSSYSGPVFMFTVTELDMTPVQMHSTQLTQSSYFALQTPYCIYGIGRTNSYIEEFSAAIPTIAHSTRMWTPIIPNSYLIVSPTKNDVDAWFLELFASPTDKIGVIIIGAVFFLVFIGGIVIYRYRREKDEDRQLAVGFL